MFKKCSIVRSVFIKNSIEKIKLSSILLACILIVSCAGKKSQYFMPLADATKQQIKSSRFVIVHGQDELNAEVNQSKLTSATGGGMLVALVDAAITNKRASEAENLLNPIRSELINFDMDQEIKQLMFPVLRSTVWLHAKNISDISIVHGNYTDIVKQISNNTTDPKDVIGIFSSNYTLNANFSALKVTLVLELYPLNSNLKNLHECSTKKNKPNQPQPIYKTRVVYNKNIETKTNNAKENAKLWLANDGQVIKNALKGSVIELSSKLNKKLQNPENQNLEEQDQDEV